MVRVRVTIRAWIRVRLTVRVWVRAIVNGEG